jgi:nitroreductase
MKKPLQIALAFLYFRYIILKIRKIGGKKMNEVLKAIKERRSIRKYKSDMLPKEIIDQVIESGLYAASGKGQQSPIIISVTNKELRDKLSRMNCEIGGWKEGFDPFFNAPVVLIVLAPKDWANKTYDGSLVMGNMMLAAHALNIGSCWINRARQEFETEEGKEILKSFGIEGEYEGIGHCILGYVDGEYPSVPARKPNRVYYVE